MIPCGTGLDIITPEERKELERIMSEGSPRAGGVCSRAADILAAVNDGVLPPPRSVEWFVLHFRSGAKRVQ
jgi:hypothetical protein